MVKVFICESFARAVVQFNTEITCLFFPIDDESWNKITCYCQKPFAGK